MAKAFSLVSWNVEHFKKEDDHVARVVDLVNAQRPDVFALYEVEGKIVFDALTRRMPGYTFHITEGEAVQEILVGVRSNMTASSPSGSRSSRGSPRCDPAPCSRSLWRASTTRFCFSIRKAGMILAAPGFVTTCSYEPVSSAVH